MFKVRISLYKKGSLLPKTTSQTLSEHTCVLVIRPKDVELLYILLYMSNAVCELVIKCNYYVRSKE